MISTPKPPDPVATASAQAQYNQQTAATTQAMNMVDQFTPSGSLVYNQTGNQTVIGANGKPIEVPKYSATTTYSPEQQKIFDTTQGAQQNLADIAGQQSDFLKGYLGTPVDLSSGNVANYVNDHFSDDFNREQDRQQNALRTQLINSGVRQGTAAYDNAMADFSTNRGNAYDNMVGNQYQNAVQSILAQRNQPINEISALLSGSQVSQPQFQSTPQTGVGGVDYTGLVNQQYQAKLQQSQAAMGGLFGLLSAPFMAFSDRRLKEDVHRVGETEEGTPIYTYRYKGDPQMHMGVMAQDVEKTDPEAVAEHPSGFKMVDYSKVH